MISSEWLQSLSPLQLLFEYYQWAAESFVDDFDLLEGIPSADNVVAAKIQQLYVREIAQRGLDGSLSAFLEFVRVNNLC